MSRAETGGEAVLCSDHTFSCKGKGLGPGALGGCTGPMRGLHQRSLEDTEGPRRAVWIRHRRQRKGGRISSTHPSLPVCHGSSAAAARLL